MNENKIIKGDNTNKSADEQNEGNDQKIEKIDEAVKDTSSKLSSVVWGDQALG